MSTAKLERPGWRLPSDIGGHTLSEKGYSRRCCQVLRRADDAVTAVVATSSVEWRATADEDGHCFAVAMMPYATTILRSNAGATGDLSRQALEALAIDEYRLGRLTHGELRRLLGFATRDALDGFLKAHGVDSPYTLDDLERERDDLRRLGF